MSNNVRYREGQMCAPTHIHTHIHNAPTRMATMGVLVYHRIHKLDKISHLSSDMSIKKIL